MRFVAGQGAVAELLTGRGTVAELLTCRDTSADWQGRCREPSGSIWQGRRGGTADLPGHQRRLAETWQRAIGKLLPARSAVAELLLAVKSYSTIGKRILAKMRARRSSCGMPVEFN